MRHLYHRSVVLLFEVLEERDEWEGGPDDDGHEGRVCMVLEYMQGGPTMTFDDESGLFKRPDGGADGGGGMGAGNAYSEDEAKPLFRDLVQGLLYLHGKNIVHRDIKVGACVGRVGTCGQERLAKGDDEASRGPSFGCCRFRSPAAFPRPFILSPPGFNSHLFPMSVCPLSPSVSRLPAAAAHLHVLERPRDSRKIS